MYQDSTTEFLKLSFGFGFWFATLKFSVAQAGHPYEKRSGGTTVIESLNVSIKIFVLQIFLFLMMYHFVIVFRKGLHKTGYSIYYISINKSTTS